VALPDSGRPDLSAWAAAVRWHIDRHSDPLLIVAHGFGCLAAVQAASDYSERIAGAMLVALPDPDNYRVTGLLPETPLAFPTVVVSSTNDLRMRSDKAAFWAGFWSASLLSIGAAGSIDEESGFGPWPQGLDILDQLRSVPPAHVAAAAKGINRATLAV
jgi:predicted alpha/beta hydrolase family esterase